jgi:tRNA A-37 threonylcarbamoyl transferase component Bud32
MTGEGRAAIGPLRWALTPASGTALSEADVDLDGHLKAGRVTTVKHGQHRTVYRVALPKGEIVYWKHCRLNGPRAWWRDFFRGPKAKLEFDRLRALHSRGVATIEPLAWARFRGRWPRGSFLITQALEGTVPLDHYLIHHPPATPEDRRKLTATLAGYVAGLHAAGVTHPDLHPGNLLIRTRDGAIEFFLIDVHDIELGPPLGPAARSRNLALLNRWFQLRTTRADRLRFWRAYAGAGSLDEEARRVEAETDRSVAGLWASRDSRCLRENRHFRRIRGAGVTGMAVRDFDAEVAAGFAADPDAPFARPVAGLLKSSQSATVCVISVPTPDGPRPMVYKRFRVTHRTDYLAAVFRPPPALRSWKNGHALIDRGLPTPRPWLVLHRRGFGLSGVGYLLCDLVPDARNLHDAVREANAGERARLADELARWIRLMHERGVSHRDLKAANILVRPDGACEFIDLVGVRTRRRVPDDVRARDLARLNASFVASAHVTWRARVRFLQTYLLRGLRGRGDWKDWWRRVARATEAKVRQNEQRNRPLA